MPGYAVDIGVTTRQRRVLEGLVRANRTSQQLAERCRIVLLSAESLPNLHQAEVLGVDRQRIRRWRGRWEAAQEALVAAEQEGVSERDLEELIVTLLSDEKRSGAPPTFSPEQVAAIIALACEPPGDSGSVAAVVGGPRFTCSPACRCWAVAKARRSKARNANAQP